jgi:hypothetical protein
LQEERIVLIPIGMKQVENKTNMILQGMTKLKSLVNADESGERKEQVPWAVSGRRTSSLDGIAEQRGVKMLLLKV